MISKLVTASISATLFVMMPAQAAHTHPDTDMSACGDVQRNAQFLLGKWDLSVETDEGWSGTGQSNVTYSKDRNCTILDKGNFTLDLGDGNSVSSLSYTMLAWDELSKKWKMMSTDSRGYTHIAFGGKLDNGHWAFEVVRDDLAPAHRRFLIRNIKDGSYDRVWQGRESEDAAWEDRLVTTHTQAK